MQKLGRNVDDAVMDTIFLRQDLAVADNVYIINGSDAVMVHRLGTRTLGISTLIGPKMYFPDTTD